MKIIFYLQISYFGLNKTESGGSAVKGYSKNISKHNGPKSIRPTPLEQQTCTSLVQINSSAFQHWEQIRNPKAIKESPDKQRMDTQKSQPDKQPSPAAPVPAVTSCRKNKSEEATFLEDVKDHIDEFINASMDEHKTCFKKTIQKMFGMSKVVAERSAAESKEVESVLPLRTTVSK